MKTRVTHTIEEYISEEFNDLADKLCVNKSKLVEKLIYNWILDHEGKK